jgi:sec-independent protein translocase protein TatA
MPTIGPMELAIVLVVALLVLGPKRLPEAGRSVGRGIREFKDSLSWRDSHDRSADMSDRASLPKSPGGEADVGALRINEG